MKHCCASWCTRATIKLGRDEHSGKRRATGQTSAQHCSIKETSSENNGTEWVMMQACAVAQKVHG